MEDSQFTKEKMIKFIIQKSGLDASIVERLAGFKLPPSWAEDNAYVSDNIESPGRLELFNQMNKERLEFSEAELKRLNDIAEKGGTIPEDEIPEEVINFIEHTEMLARETGFKVETVELFLWAYYQWNDHCMAELKRMSGLKD